MFLPTQIEEIRLTLVSDSGTNRECCTLISCDISFVRILHKPGCNDEHDAHRQAYVFGFSLEWLCDVDARLESSHDVCNQMARTNRELDVARMTRTKREVQTIHIYRN